MTLPKNSNFDNTQFQNLKRSFSKNNLTPQKLMRCSLGILLGSCNVLIITGVEAWIKIASVQAWTHI